MTAYFCRRNVKGKDDGMIEGKANMQFVGSLNRLSPVTATFHRCLRRWP